ncbi:MAG: hypothetical protein CMN78_01925 [Spirochaetales bacterium]|nr:hypothetical protein [Spirochaetales bacterium]
MNVSVRRHHVIVFLLIWPAVWAFGYDPSTFSEHSAEQERFLLGESVAGGQELHIAYVDAGPEDGPVVLLIHGVPTSSWAYRKVSASLAALGYRVIAPDNLGFGNSAKPSGREYYSMRLQAERLLALMDYLGIPSWLQVLHDVGGLITWEMLGVASHRIEGLVILNTFAYEEGWHPPRSLENPLVQFSMGLIGFKNRAIIRTTICNMLVLPDKVDNDISLAGYYDPLLDGADEAYLAFMTSLDEVRERLPEYQQILRTHGKPAVIIWGGHDETLVGEEAIPLFKRDLRIPDYNIFLRGDAKHLIMEELPALIVDRIIIFYPHSK